MKKILTQYGVCALAVALMVTLAQAQTQTPAPGTSFRDCSNGCPEMMVVQQGRFTMGAPAVEEARENLPNELRGSSVPQHLINQNFAGIGRSSRGITKCCEHYFQRGFWQARSLELRRRERRMPAARCLRKDSRAFMRVHRDTAWAPDNSVP
jgi:hypothetical protein